MNKTDSPLAEIHKKPLKIAILVRHFVTTGGMERYCVEVTRQLARNHEVHVFAQAWTWNGSEKIHFHKIPRFLEKPSFLNQLIFSYFTRKYLDETYDIIHSHERVTHFDTMTVHCPCFRTYITEEQRWWKRLFLWLSIAVSPRKMAYLWLEKRQFLYKQERILITVSDMIKKNVQANYSLPDDYFGMAYPGVDSELMKRANNEKNRAKKRSELGLKKEDLVVLFVGTEFKRKGLEALFRGFALIDRTDLILIVAGGGEQEKYRRLAHKLRIENRVLFLGMVEEIEKLYAIADIYILPTLLEPAGMSPIEAMASGIPTIMSSSTYAGSAELIKNNEAILLEHPEKPVDIANSINRLMDEEYRSELGRRGQGLAAQLTWGKTTKDTLDVYKRILKKKEEYGR